MRTTRGNSRIAAVGRNCIASGASGAIASPNIRLPASLAVNVRHPVSVCGSDAKLSPGPSQSTMPRQHNWLPAKAAGKLNITKCGMVMFQGLSRPCRPRR